MRARTLSSIVPGAPTDVRVDGVAFAGAAPVVPLLPLEHALNIDFVNEAQGPGARVAVELSIDAARKLVQTIEAVLAQAEKQGVAEDRLQTAHS